MPNIIAYSALLLWPLAIVWMFRKMPPERAFIWAILGGYMLLPEATEFNLPMIPALDKTTLPNLTALVVAIMVAKQRFGVFPKGFLARLALIFLVIAPVASVFVNADPLQFGAMEFGRLQVVTDTLISLPGMRIYDSISALARTLFLLVPFIMARRLLASEAMLVELLRALMIAGLIYSVPMLYEVRFSPQLHTDIYGFFQHDFGQMMREGGFRPIVFMPHGLWVAFFAAMALLSAAYFLRIAPASERTRHVLIVLYLFVVLWLCKSVGARVFGILLLPLILFFTAKAQVRVAAAMAAVALSYPLLRGADLIPTRQLIAYLYARMPERAQSLEFRFDNEDLLLARAWEKPLVGWGGWGRNLIRDPMSGEIVTISDGMWVIAIGQYGWIGFLGMFGLLCLPLFALWLAYRRVPVAQVPLAVGVCALLHGANLIDLLPNATLTPLTWLLAGALLGHAEVVRAQARSAGARLPDGLRRDGLLAPARLHGLPGEGRKGLLR